MITKAISEEHFIRVVYDLLCDFYIRDIHKIDKETQEKYARHALDLHKDYWERCKREYDKIYYNEQSIEDELLAAEKNLPWR